MCIYWAEQSRSEDYIRRRRKRRKKRCPAVPPRLQRQAYALGHSWEDKKTTGMRRERERKEKAGGLLPVAYILLVMHALAFNRVLACSKMAILQAWHRFRYMTARGGLSHAIWMKTRHFVQSLFCNLLWMLCVAVVMVNTHTHTSVWAWFTSVRACF